MWCADRETRWADGASRWADGASRWADAASRWADAASRGAMEQVVLETRGFLDASGCWQRLYVRARMHLDTFFNLVLFSG